MKRSFPTWNVRRHLNNLFLAIALGFSLLPLHVAAERPPLSHTMTVLSPPQTAADFTLPDMDGEAYTLSSYRGKVVMLDFWGHW